jgi:DNA-binding NtrC family response regulator
MNANGDSEPIHFASAEGSPMRLVLEMLDRVAPSGAGILILGEPGTGKETLARRAHERSRREGPFVAARCGSLAEGRPLEDLFGAGPEGAEEAAGGLFAEALGGTLFLEDLTELPASAQAALVFRLGRPGPGAEARRPRVIAASARAIPAEALGGGIRRDLYDSLPCSIEVPPLRSRPADAAAVFLRLWREREPERSPPPEALDLVREWPWPGNVRELDAFATRLALLAEGRQLGRRDVEALLARQAGGPEPLPPRPGPPPAHATPTVIDLPVLLQQLEYAVIDWALEMSNGNKACASDLIGIHRTTLVEKLRRRPGAAPLPRPRRTVGRVPGRGAAE